MVANEMYEKLLYMQCNIAMNETHLVAGSLAYTRQRKNNAQTYKQAIHIEINTGFSVDDDGIIRMCACVCLGFWGPSIPTFSFISY